MSSLHHQATAAHDAGHSVPGTRKNVDRWSVYAFLLCALLAIWPDQSSAQAPAPGVDSQFDVLGFIQEATLDNCGTPALCGGKIKVNGQTIVVPSNLIVILPANALTWAELFSQAPAPYTKLATGMAMNDLPAPLTTYEAHVIGNQVNDVFVAGLLDIHQQSLNAGAGFINFIDYATGELRVGGQLMRDTRGVPINALSNTNQGARVRLNDPTGAFGRKSSADARMTLDAENPTVRSTTGFPMCVPRSDPAIAPEDAACPQLNRPKDANGQFVTKFMMSLPAMLSVAVPSQALDPRLMAPFEVGDYVSYAGTLAMDGGTTYLSAHTMTGNLAIYTQPGSDPAYVAIDVSILGNGGVIEPGNLEATVRTRFEGFTTDPSRDVQLFGIDYSPIDGSASDRLWGIVGVDPGPPNGAVLGRWRFRPPCTGVTATFRFCFGPLIETTFLPATREVRAAVAGTWVTPRTAREKNGLIAGQYHAPISEFLFAENMAGTTPPPVDLASLPFLAQGGYSSASGQVGGRLSPFPGSAPAVACTPATASAGTNFSVASGTKAVLLNGTATGSGNLSFVWTPPATVTLAPSATVLTPTFDAPVVTSSTDLVFTLAVTGCNAISTTTSVTVTVTPPVAGAVPVVAPMASRSINSGTTVKLTASGTGGHPLAYTWTQSSGPAQAFTQVPDSPTIDVTHVLKNNQVTDDVLSYTVVARDTVTAAVSLPVTTALTYTPTPDVETVTLAEYRVGKQRLDITITSSAINPAVALKLAPYTTTTGATFDPKATGNTFVTTGAGVYTLALIGVPQPGATLQVNSNIRGSTGSFALTKVRP